MHIDFSFFSAQHASGVAKWKYSKNKETVVTLQQYINYNNSCKESLRWKRINEKNNRERQRYQLKAEVITSKIDNQHTRTQKQVSTERSGRKQIVQIHRQWKGR